MKLRSKKDGTIINVPSGLENQVRAIIEAGGDPTELLQDNQMAKGGMIKRADGSYSRRGLWDNIRAKAAANKKAGKKGKKPTKTMLEQEAEIRAAEKAYGGYMASGGCMECGGMMESGGMLDQAGDGKWIQKATASIKRRGTEGVCTGSKFGGPSCPPGSKRYNLAKTFRKMAKSRKDDGGLPPASGGMFVNLGKDKSGNIMQIDNSGNLISAMPTSQNTFAANTMPRYVESSPDINYASNELVENARRMGKRERRKFFANENAKERGDFDQMFEKEPKQKRQRSGSSSSLFSRISPLGALFSKNTQNYNNGNTLQMIDAMIPNFDRYGINFGYNPGGYGSYYNYGSMPMMNPYSYYGYEDGGELPVAQIGKLQSMLKDEEDYNQNDFLTRVNSVIDEDLLPKEPSDLEAQNVRSSISEFGDENDLRNLKSATRIAKKLAVDLPKNILDTIGTNRQNRAIQAERQNALSMSAYSQARAEGDRPYKIYGEGILGENPLAADGMQIRQIGGMGEPNVEVEGKEHIKLPNGFSQEIKGKSHVDGGIRLNLPQGTQIFSEKLKIEISFLKQLAEINPEYEFLKSISLPKSGKISYADLAKKFETKKYVDLLNSKSADPIQMATAQMMIAQNVAKLEKIFMLQEQNKISGVHGPQVQQKAMEENQEVMAQEQAEQQQEPEEPMMAHGGYHLPKAQGGKDMTPFESTSSSRQKPKWWGKREELEKMMENFSKASGYEFPYYPPNTDENKMASDYQKAVIRKYPQIITNLFKNKTFPFTNKAIEIYNKQNKTKGTPSEEELVKFYNKNPELITDQFGDQLWGMRGFKMHDLPFSSPEEFRQFKKDPDWIPIGNGYYYDTSGANETPMVFKPKFNYTKEDKIEPETPRKKPDLNQPAPSKKQQEMMRSPGFNINIPFGADTVAPINFLTYDPNLVTLPKVQPYTYDIDRAMRAGIMNATDLTGAGIANRQAAIASGLAERAARQNQANLMNLENQKQQEITNANILNNWKAQMAQQYGDYEQKRLQAIGASETQKEMRKVANEQNMAKALGFDRDVALARQNLYPAAQWNPGTAVAYMPIYNSPVQQQEATPAQAEPVQGSKYGGRIKKQFRNKLKTKRFK